MRRQILTMTILGATLALGTGCPTRAVSNLQPHEDKENVKEIPVNVNRNIDILFVVDNSGSMSAEQVSLATNIPRFINVLETIEGGLPNVHIGVVSSNMGIGGFSTGGCTGQGDNGRLQNAPRGACTPPSGYFISYEKDGDGNEIKNYTGTLADTFSCIARLGSTGCGLEQHLESMKAALDDRNPENSQFLRDNAYLAVIFLADEDDCSAEDGTVFDPSQDTISDPLGPFGSFRCTEFGIQCSDAPIGRTPASYEDCEPFPDTDTNYLWHPDRYVTFLKGLKDDPKSVIVAGIIGNPEPVAVALDSDGLPELVKSCGGAGGDNDGAVPAVRLRYFLEQFPDRNTFTSICNEDLSTAMEVIANLLKRVVGNPCLDGDIDATDIDTSTPGLQLQCQVADVLNLGDDNESGTPMPRCEMQADGTWDPNASDIPCWWASDEPESCPDTDTGILLHIERNNADPPIGTTVVARCVGASE